VNDAQELKVLILSLLKMQGKKPSKMLEDLGFSTALISNLGLRRGVPSIDRICKMASYLNVSVDYLFGIYPSGKAPNDVAREAYWAIPKEDRKAILERVLALNGEADPKNDAKQPECDSKCKKLQSSLDDFKNELLSSIEELRVMQNDIGEKLSSLESLASTPDQRETVMAHFLALPIHLKKIFLQEAVENANYQS
jgi:transcriptional regulator with XRE-family HTH domain